MFQLLTLIGAIFDTFIDFDINLYETVQIFLHHYKDNAIPHKTASTH